MTSYTWKGVSGHWRIASDWSPAGGPPTASDAATISGSGTYTVTVRRRDVANSLTLSDANATLNDDGYRASLTIRGALRMSNGTLNIHGDSLGVGVANGRRRAHDEQWNAQRRGLAHGRRAESFRRRPDHRLGAQPQRNAEPDGRNADSGQLDPGRDDRFDRGNAELARLRAERRDLRRAYESHFDERAADGCPEQRFDRRRLVRLRTGNNQRHRRWS